MGFLLALAPKNHFQLPAPLAPVLVRGVQSRELGTSSFFTLKSISSRPNHIPKVFPVKPLSLGFDSPTKRQQKRIVRSHYYGDLFSPINVTTRKCSLTIGTVFCPMGPYSQLIHMKKGVEEVSRSVPKLTRESNQRNISLCANRYVKGPSMKGGNAVPISSPFILTRLVGESMQSMNQPIEEDYREVRGVHGIPGVRKMSSQQFKTIKVQSQKAQNSLSLGTNRVNETFWNVCFDKGRLKNFVSWFYKTYGNYKTVQLVEQLKNVGFQYATKSGLSLGIDDLKIPPKKGLLMLETEQQAKKTVNQYNRGEITGVERFQRLIDAWHRTSELLKQEVINNFEKTDILNPVYMMAFSGARGNISQVRQLVGMRGLMADPQGQILDFPIRSNFREGLTLTEYIISCYGARKGIVDTALRTANAGYLTRRLVDVAQHVIVSHYDCGTKKGIFLKDMKEGNKTIYSLQNRLVGRVLAQDLMEYHESDNSHNSHYATVNFGTVSLSKKTIAFRNQEVSTDLAFKISQVYKKVFVRSPLTCGTKKLVCQLCYGWSLAQGNLVSIGEAVGVIAAQSIGEPGTQLTMRTFHTGGVFSGDLTELIQAPYSGFVRYAGLIPGTLIRTPQGQIAFLTKDEGVIFLLKNNKITNRESTDKLASVSNEQSSVSSNNETPTIPSPGEVAGANISTKSSMGTNRVNETDLMNTFFASITDFKYTPNELELAKKFKIPAYTILFVRNGENVIEKQILAQISSFSRQKNMRDTAELTIKSELEGQFYAESLETVEKLIGPKLKDEDLRSNYDYVHFLPIKRQYPRNRNVGHPHYPAIEKIKEAWDWSSAWILSGKIYQFPMASSFFPKTGDLITQHSPLTQIQWILPESTGQFYSLNLSSSYSVRDKSPTVDAYGSFSTDVPKNLSNSRHYNAVNCKKTLNVEKSILLLKAKFLKYSKIGYFLKTVPSLSTTYSTSTLNLPAKLISEDSIFAPFSAFGPTMTKSFDFSPSNVEFSPDLEIEKEATAVNSRHWNPLLNNFVEWFPNKTKMSTGGLLALENCLFKPRLFVGTKSHFRTKNQRILSGRFSAPSRRIKHHTYSKSLGNWEKGPQKPGGAWDMEHSATSPFIHSFRGDSTKKRTTKSFFFTTVSKNTLELKSHYMYLMQLQHSLFGVTYDSSLSQTEFKNLVSWSSSRVGWRINPAKRMRKQDKMPKSSLGTNRVKQSHRTIRAYKGQFEPLSVMTILNNFSAFSKIANFEYQFKLDPKHRLYEQFRHKNDTGYQHLQSLQIPAPYVAHRNRKIFSANVAGNQTTIPSLPNQRFGSVGIGKRGGGVANKKQKTDVKSLGFLHMQWKNPLISTLNPNTTAFTVPKTKVEFFNFSKTRLFWIPQQIYKLNLSVSPKSSNKHSLSKSLVSLRGNWGSFAGDTPQTGILWHNNGILCVNRQQKPTHLIGSWPFSYSPFYKSDGFSLFNINGLIRCFVGSIKKKPKVLSDSHSSLVVANSPKKLNKKGSKKLNQTNLSYGGHPSGDRNQKGTLILLNKKHFNSMLLFLKLRSLTDLGRNQTSDHNYLPQIGLNPNLICLQTKFRYSKCLKNLNIKILFYKNDKPKVIKLLSLTPSGSFSLSRMAGPIKSTGLPPQRKLQQHLIKLHMDTLQNPQTQTVLDPKLVNKFNRGHLLRSFTLRDSHFRPLELSTKPISSTPFRANTAFNLGLNHAKHDQKHSQNLTVLGQTHQKKKQNEAPSYNPSKNSPVVSQSTSKLLKVNKLISMRSMMLRMKWIPTPSFGTSDTPKGDGKSVGNRSTALGTQRQHFPRTVGSAFGGRIYAKHESTQRTRFLNFNSSTKNLTVFDFLYSKLQDFQRKLRRTLTKKSREQYSVEKNKLKTLRFLHNMYKANGNGQLLTLSNFNRKTSLVHPFQVIPAKPSVSLRGSSIWAKGTKELEKEDNRIPHLHTKNVVCWTQVLHGWVFKMKPSAVRRLPKQFKIKQGQTHFPREAFKGNRNEAFGPAKRFYFPGQVIFDTLIFDRDLVCVEPLEAIGSLDDYHISITPFNEVTLNQAKIHSFNPVKKFLELKQKNLKMESGALIPKESVNSSNFAPYLTSPLLEPVESFPREAFKGCEVALSVFQSTVTKSSSDHKFLWVKNQKSRFNVKISNYSIKSSKVPNYSKSYLIRKVIESKLPESFEYKKMVSTVTFQHSQENLNGKLAKVKAFEIPESYSCQRQFKLMPLLNSTQNPSNPLLGNQSLEGCAVYTKYKQKVLGEATKRKKTNILINKAWNSRFIYQQFKSDSVNKQIKTSNTIIKFPKTDFNFQAKTSFASLLIKLKNNFITNRASSVAGVKNGSIPLRPNRAWGWDKQKNVVSGWENGTSRTTIKKRKSFSQKTKKSSKIGLTGTQLKELNAIFNKHFQSLLLDTRSFKSQITRYAPDFGMEHLDGYSNMQAAPNGLRAKKGVGYPRSPLFAWVDTCSATPNHTTTKIYKPVSRSRKKLRGIKLDLLSCQKPVNLNSFLIDLKSPYGLNSIFKKPTVYFNCNNRASVIPKFWQKISFESLECYESLLHIVLQSRLNKEQPWQHVKNLSNTKKSVRRRVLPTLYNQLSITFEQPCFNFCLATSLNLLKRNKLNPIKKTITHRHPSFTLRDNHNYMSGFPSESKNNIKKQTTRGFSGHKTKFHVNLNNKFSSYNAFAKTSFFSSFEGEILKPSYLPSRSHATTTKGGDAALKKAWGVHRLPGVRDNLVNSSLQANKKIPSWFLREIQFNLKQNKHSCLMLTKKDLRSFATGLSVSKTTVLRQLFLGEATNQENGPLQNHPYGHNGIGERGSPQKVVLKQLLKLGQFMSKGDLIKTKQLALRLEHGQLSLPNRPVRDRFGSVKLHKIIKGVKTSGQIVHVGIRNITLRAGQSIFISPQSIFHVSEGSYVNAKSPVITLAYQRLKTGDIVQGIPKVEQFFEARSTKGSRLFHDSLPNLLVALYKRYSQTKTGAGSKKRILTNQEAVRQSFYKIQQIVVDGVQRVYLSQGVAISDKHLEIIVKQMTSKVIIVAGGPDGFFPGEMVDIDFVEKINKLLINKKIKYEPVLLGITRASLEVPSFLSAASFQQSTRILTRAALFTKKDYLRGLKENIMLGNLIPAGTGYLISDLFKTSQK